MSSEFNFQAWWNGETDQDEGNQSETEAQVTSTKTYQPVHPSEAHINPPSNLDFCFKLLLVGDSGVGKSCLLLRFADDSFTENYISTIGVDFKIHNVTLDDKHIKLQVWDTAGQERFRTITTSYYRGTNGVIITFDITSEESFKHAENWLEEVSSYAPDSAVRMLVGTKSDLQFQRAVEYAVAKEFADKHNLVYMEASSKDATGVEHVFLSMAKTILAQNDA